VELLPWIRSWGSGVEVLEPPELRRQVVEDLRLAMERYGGRDSLRRRLRKRG